MEHEFKKRSKKSEFDDEDLKKFMTDTYAYYFGSKKIDNIYQAQEINEQKELFIETFSLLGNDIKVNQEAED